MRPFFSIIIPVYNVAPYLRECLDSVLSQTFTDWEAICIDDGSTDGSSDILDEYAIRDHRFRVIHQPNAGVSAARNAGLDAINGNWVLFLDGDDVWHLRLLEKVRAMIKTYPTDSLFRFAFKPFDGKFEAAPLDGKKSGKETYEVIDILKEISMHDFFDYLFWCYAYSRYLFDGIRFPRYIRGEDRCVLNRIMLDRADAIVATDMPLYGYRIRQGSAMNSSPSRQVLLDEMDHRLDIMEMIDKSCKSVHYANNAWLEKYFTTQFYHIVNFRGTDKQDIVLDWRNRLHRLKRMKGLSHYGRFVALSGSIIRLHLWDMLICYIMPRFFERVSSIRFNKRKLVCG